MTTPPTTDPTSVLRLVVGAILLVGGVVVWVVTDTAWIGGLISGAGVVVGYTAISPAVERWRQR